MVVQREKDKKKRNTLEEKKHDSLLFLEVLQQPAVEHDKVPVR